MSAWEEAAAASVGERAHEVWESTGPHQNATPTAQMGPSTCGAVQVPTATHVPKPFSLKADGVYYDDTRICGRLEVVACTRDADSNEWGRIVEFRDPDGNPKRWAIPMRLLAGDGSEVRAELLSRGLTIGAERQAGQRLLQYLQQTQPPQRARCVPQIGWYGTRFVLPAEVIGSSDTDDQVVFQPIGTLPAVFTVRGDLVAWQERVAALCVGNSRLVLAVAMAFAAPLARTVGLEGGGVHLQGASSTGKTTALLVASSVWGADGVRSWRTTDNALESTAAMSNDALLCLDEIGQVDGAKLGECAYMLANGHGRRRAGRDGHARREQRWQVLFLSTGEVSLAVRMAEANRTSRAGQEIRLVDVPADADAGLGLFENIHGRWSAAEFATDLQGASRELGGTAIRMFLETLAKDASAGPSAVAARLRNPREAFLRNHPLRDSNGQVHRVRERFATIAAAGEYASELGILPWPKGEAIRGVGKCFEDWLQERGGVESTEVIRGIEQVRHFFEKHGSARFESAESREVTMDGDEFRRPVANRAGFKLANARSDGARYLVYPNVMKKEILAGLNHKLICAEMLRRGVLVGDSAGKTSRSEYDPDSHKTQRFYVVTDRIFERGVDEAETEEWGLPGAEDEVPV